MKTLNIIATICVCISTMSCKQSTTTTVIKSSDLTSETAKKAGEVDHYICFRENDLKDLEMSVSFDTYNNALEVIYKGQAKSMFLTYVDEVVITPGQPATKTVYTESTEGTVSGTYEFIHSDDSEYAKYIRKEDGEVFNFTIDHDQTVIGEGYRDTPCY